MSAERSQGAKLAGLFQPDAALRLMAEERARGDAIRTGPGPDTMSQAQMRAALHELRVHQIELEMQNNELRQTQLQLELSRARYVDLYEDAPVGYCTACENGLIQQLNPCAAAMLGLARAALLARPLTRYLHAADQDHYYLLKRRLADTGATQSCELRLAGPERRPRWIHLTASQGRDEAGAPVLLIVFTDIDLLKRTQDELKDDKAAAHDQQQLHARLRQLSAHQDWLKEDERKRTARDIHDELGQNLLALRLDLAALYARTAGEQQRLHARTGTALDCLDQAIASVRGIMNSLRPAVLDLGLEAACEWQLKEFRRRSGVAAELLGSDADVGSNEVRDTALFRVLQEALNNVERHAQASQVSVMLRRQGENVQLIVSDDGVGLPAHSGGGAYGLMAIKERVESFGGSVDIHSRPGCGLSLEVTMPLAAKAASAAGGSDTEALRIWRKFFRLFGLDADEAG